MWRCGTIGMCWRFAALSLSLSLWILFEEFIQQLVLQQCDGTIAVVLKLYSEKESADGSKVSS